MAVVNRRKLLEELLTPGQKHQNTRTLALKQNVRCLCVVNDRLWEASRDGSVHVRDFDTGELLNTVHAQQVSTTSTLPFHVNAFYVQEDRVWAGSSDGVVRVYDATGDKLLLLCAEHPAGVRCIAGPTDLNANVVYTGSEDWTILVRDGRDGRALKQLGGHTSWIRCLIVYEYTPETAPSVSPKAANRVVEVQAEQVVRSNVVECWSGSDDGIRVWNSAGECVAVLTEHGKDNDLQPPAPTPLASTGSAQSYHTTSTADSESRASSTTDLASLASPRHAAPASPRRAPSAPSQPASIARTTVLALCKVGDSVWSAGADRCVCIWDARQKTLVKKFKAHSHMVTLLRHVGDEVWSATSTGKQVFAWDAATGDFLHAVQLPPGSGAPSDIVVHGKRVWIGTRNPGSLICYRIFPQEVNKSLDRLQAMRSRQQQFKATATRMDRRSASRNQSMSTVLSGNTLSRSPSASSSMAVTAESGGSTVSPAVEQVVTAPVIALSAPMAANGSTETASPRDGTPTAAAVPAITGTPPNGTKGPASLIPRRRVPASLHLHAKSATLTHSALPRSPQSAETPAEHDQNIHRRSFSSDTSPVALSPRYSRRMGRPTSISTMHGSMRYHSRTLSSASSRSDVLSPYPSSPLSPSLPLASSAASVGVQAIAVQHTHHLSVQSIPPPPTRRTTAAASATAAAVTMSRSPSRVSQVSDQSTAARSDGTESEIVPAVSDDKVAAPVANAAPALTHSPSQDRLRPNVAALTSNSPTNLYVQLGDLQAKYDDVCKKLKRREQSLMEAQKKLEEQVVHRVNLTKQLQEVFEQKESTSQVLQQKLAEIETLSQQLADYMALKESHHELQHQLKTVSTKLYESKLVRDVPGNVSIEWTTHDVSSSGAANADTVRAESRVSDGVPLVHQVIEEEKVEDLHAEAATDQMRQKMAANIRVLHALTQQYMAAIERSTGSESTAAMQDSVVVPMGSEDSDDDEEAMQARLLESDVTALRALHEKLITLLDPHSAALEVVHSAAQRPVPLDTTVLTSAVSAEALVVAVPHTVSDPALSGCATDSDKAMVATQSVPELTDGSMQTNALLSPQNSTTHDAPMQTDDVAARARESTDQALQTDITGSGPATSQAHQDVQTEQAETTDSDIQTDALVPPTNADQNVQTDAILVAASTEQHVQTDTVVPLEHTHQDVQTEQADTVHRDMQTDVILPPESVHADVQTEAILPPESAHQDVQTDGVSLAETLHQDVQTDDIQATHQNVQTDTMVVPESSHQNVQTDTAEITDQDMQTISTEWCDQDMQTEGPVLSQHTLQDDVQPQRVCVCEGEMQTDTLDVVSLGTQVDPIVTSIAHVELQTDMPQLAGSEMHTQTDVNEVCDGTAQTDSGAQTHKESVDAKVVEKQKQEQKKLRSQLRGKDSELNKLRRQMAELDEELSRLTHKRNADVSDLQTRVSESELAVTHSRQEHQEALQALVESQRAIEVMVGREQEWQSKWAKTSESLAALEAEKAQAVRKLSNPDMGLRASYERLQADAKEMDRQRAQVEDTLQYTQAERTRVGAVLSELQRDHAELQRLLTTTQGELQERDSHIATLQATVEELRATVDDMTAQVQNTERAAARTAIQDVEEKNADLITRLTQAESQLESAQAAQLALQQQLAAHVARHSQELERQTHHWAQQLSHEHEQLELERSLRAQLETDLATVRDHARQLENELAAAVTQRAQLVEQWEAERHRQAETLSTTVAGWQEQLTAAQQQLAAQQEATVTAQQVTSVEREKVELLYTQSRELERQLDALSEVVRQQTRALSDERERNQRLAEQVTQMETQLTTQSVAASVDNPVAMPALGTQDDRGPTGSTVRDTNRSSTGSSSDDGTAQSQLVTVLRQTISTLEHELAAQTAQRQEAQRACTDAETEIRSLKARLTTTPVTAMEETVTSAGSQSSSPSRISTDPAAQHSPSDEIRIASVTTSQDSPREATPQVVVTEVRSRTAHPRGSPRRPSVAARSSRRHSALTPQSLAAISAERETQINTLQQELSAVKAMLQEEQTRRSVAEAELRERLLEREELERHLDAVTQEAQELHVVVQTKQRDCDLKDNECRLLLDELTAVRLQHAGDEPEPLPDGPRILVDDVTAGDPTTPTMTTTVDTRVSESLAPDFSTRAEHTRRTRAASFSASVLPKPHPSLLDFPTDTLRSAGTQTEPELIREVSGEGRPAQVESTSTGATVAVIAETTPVTALAGEGDSTVRQRVREQDEEIARLQLLVAELRDQQTSHRATVPALMPVPSEHKYDGDSDDTVGPPPDERSILRFVQTAAGARSSGGVNVTDAQDSRPRAQPQKVDLSESTDQGERSPRMGTIPPSSDAAAVERTASIIESTPHRRYRRSPDSLTVNGPFGRFGSDGQAELLSPVVSPLLSPRTTSSVAATAFAPLNLQQTAYLPLLRHLYGYTGTNGWNVWGTPTPTQAPAVTGSQLADPAPVSVGPHPQETTPAKAAESDRSSQASEDSFDSDLSSSSDDDGDEPRHKLAEGHATAVTVSAASDLKTDSSDKKGAGVEEEEEDAQQPGLINRRRKWRQRYRRLVHHIRSKYPWYLLLAAGAVVGATGVRVFMGPPPLTLNPTQLAQLLTIGIGAGWQLGHEGPITDAVEFLDA